MQARVLDGWADRRTRHFQKSSGADGTSVISGGARPMTRADMGAEPGHPIAVG